ncbi:MAG: PCRF domain-containing protein, partial [Acidimicrobiales bacterium]
MSADPGDGGFDARLDALEAELEQVHSELADPATAADPARLRDLSRRHKELAEVVYAWRELRKARADLDTARQMLEGAAGEDRETVQSEVEAAEASISAIRARLSALLLPKDPNDGRNVIVEIRGAEGGEEANLFARDLFDMYCRYAARRGWHMEVLSERQSERDGLNEAVFVVKGADAWSRLEHEAGPHRVQRVPVTESKGRVHTSSATVTVLPEADEVEVSIDPADLKVDVYRSTGPG